MPIPITRVKNKEQAKQFLSGMKNIRDKVLDSKVAKKVMIPVGNTVIKGVTAPLKWAGKQVEKEMKMNKAKDNIYRSQGQKMNEAYSGLPSSVKYKK